MVKYRIVPERSQMTIEAKSSVHPIHAEASGVTGVVEADVSDGKIAFGTPPTLRLEAPVDSFKTGNPLYDSELQKRLDSRRYPTVAAAATEIGEPDGSGRSRARGDISLHGVTQAATGDLTVSAPDERTLVIEGEQMLDIRDFGLTPPKLLLLKVYPEITARIHLVAEREGN